VAAAAASVALAEAAAPGVRSSVVGTTATVGQAKRDAGGCD